MRDQHLVNQESHRQWMVSVFMIRQRHSNLPKVPALLDANLALPGSHLTSSDELPTAAHPEATTPVPSTVKGDLSMTALAPIPQGQVSSVRDGIVAY